MCDKGVECELLGVASFHERGDPVHDQVAALWKVAIGAPVEVAAGDVEARLVAVP